jgi:hypothetical protein
MYKFLSSSTCTVLYSMLQEILPLLPLVLNLGSVSLIRCHIVLLKENLPYFHRDYSRKTNWLYSNPGGYKKVHRMAALSLKCLL